MSRGEPGPDQLVDLLRPERLPPASPARSATAGAPPTPRTHLRAGLRTAAERRPRPSGPSRDRLIWIAVLGIGLALLLASITALGVDPRSVGMALSIPMLVVAAVAHRSPGAAAVAVGALAMLHLLLGAMVAVGDLAILYVLFIASSRGSAVARRVAVISSAGVLAAATLVALGRAAATGNGFVLPLAMLVLGALAMTGTWALGRLDGARRDREALIEERAAQTGVEREQRAALAVAEERARISREMHDVIAHSLSVIIAQADGARFVAAANPELAAETLGTIAQTGRNSLADLRRVLRVMREDDPMHAPLDDLSSLPALLSRVRSSGLDVTAQQQGDLGSLPPQVSMALFRIVQESLTNVMKHAGRGARAWVSLRRAADVVHVEVFDDGRGADPASDGMGQGLRGMRERAALVGGTLESGPAPTGGYRVRVRIPCPQTKEP